MRSRQSSLFALTRCATRAAAPALLLAAGLSLVASGFVTSMPGVPTGLARLVIDGRADSPFLLFGASTGAPVTWGVAGGALAGDVSLLAHLRSVPWIGLIVLIPMLPGVVLARATTRQAVRTGRPRRLLLPVATVAYGLLLAVTAAALEAATSHAHMVSLHVDIPLVASLGALWAGVAALPSLALPSSVGRRSPRVSIRRRAAALSGLIVAALVAPSAVAQPAPGPDAAPAPTPPSSDPAAARALTALPGPDHGRAVAAWNRDTHTPSSVLLDDPFGGDGKAWLTAHRALIGGAPSTHLRPDGRRQRAARDLTKKPGAPQLDYWYQQVVNGIPVYHGTVGLHLDPTGKKVWAISNSYVPELENAPTDAHINADQAVTEAKRALPRGHLAEQPVLYLRPSADPSDHGSRLLWRVWLMDDTHGVSNEYWVDARNDRGILDVVDQNREELDRRVYDAGHTMVESLPDHPVRTEGGPSTGDNDVDHAYAYTGATYEYYKETFGRDSYDDSGAALASLVHFGVGYENAHWDGSKMIFGDGWGVLDVTGHELTHAVTEHTAGLEYHDQSGALNESFSDIFGEMVERFIHGSNDWLEGADIPFIGPIRSFIDPEAYQQPSNFSGYQTPCLDGGGVHTNSGIPNHAFYLATQSPDLTIDEAAFIYYVALKDYLSGNADFADARNATIAAAWRLYGKGSAQANAIDQAWQAVGVDESTPPRSASAHCTCVAGRDLESITYPADGPTEAQTRATLYQARDLVAEESPAVAYYVTLYNEDSALLDPIVQENQDIADEFGAVILQLEPLIDYANSGGTGDPVTVTQADVDAVNHLFDDIITADQARAGGGALTESIQTRWRALDYTPTVGLTADKALDLLDQQAEQLPGS